MGKPLIGRWGFGNARILLMINYLQKKKNN